MRTHGWRQTDYNEAEIGEVFKKTKVPRSEYFVTTKLLGIPFFPGPLLIMSNLDGPPTTAA